ncbi:hypothetical protein KCM76_19485 [Zooshikella marina]|uniref:hypothetical protein n=1 Tax=Zooshikella ganghwensis TaxID=202772 RepID=UPI001BAF1268|nr:hypothetical protein [Zooshikella ganghwensis]MBU2708184.1 hypothetical protein [Zooshikella ganghwensis]
MQTSWSMPLKIILITIYAVFFNIILIFAVYGDFFAIFYPSQQVSYWAKNIALIHLFIMMPILVASHAFNEKLIPKERTKFKMLKFYLVTYIGIPIIAAVLSSIVYAALAKGVPGMLSLYNTEGIVEEIKVVHKDKWGKRDRRKSVYFEDYDGMASVSTSTYNRVSVGDSIKVLVIRSSLGTKIEILN